MRNKLSYPWTELMVVAVVTFFLLPLSGFAGTKVRLAQPVIAVMYAPLYFGAKQGIFTSEGLELEFLTMRTDLAIAALGVVILVQFIWLAAVTTLFMGENVEKIECNFWALAISNE